MNHLRNANDRMPESSTLSQNTSIKRARKGRSRVSFSGGNRFALLAAVIVIILLVILLRTSSLQIFSSREISIPETSGSAGELVLEAQRGDIVDRNGLPLAVSDAVYRVSLISTGMTSAIESLSSRCCRSFRKFGCTFQSPLLKWLDVPSEMRDENLLKSDQSLRFVFRQPLEDVLRWQTI